MEISSECLQPSTKGKRIQPRERSDGVSPMIARGEKQHRAPRPDDAKRAPRQKGRRPRRRGAPARRRNIRSESQIQPELQFTSAVEIARDFARSEEHTSELQSL